MPSFELQDEAVHGISRESDSPWLLRVSAAAVLLSAALLFLVQPMFAKMIPNFMKAAPSD